MSEENSIRRFIELRGASGRPYRFRLWPTDEEHLPIAGNYVCVSAQGAALRIVSVGETLDLSRLRTELSRKVKETTTHLYTRLNVARATRSAEHEDLLAGHDTGAGAPAEA